MLNAYITDQKSKYDGIKVNAKLNPNLTTLLSYLHMCKPHRLRGGVEEV